MPSVLLKGRYKNLDVKKAIQYSNESHFSHQRSLATELTALYLENKTAALMGSVSNPRLFPRCVRGWTTVCGGISSRAVPPRGLAVFDLIRTAVSTIWPKTTMNSSTNKQIHDFAYFDKYYAVPMLKQIVLCMSFIKGCYLVNSIKCDVKIYNLLCSYFTCYQSIKHFQPYTA